MADKKISALTGASTPLAGTEVLPIVQGGATVKVSVDNLTTGKAVTVKSLNTTTGLSGATQATDIIISRTSSTGAVLTGPNIYLDDGTANNTIAIQNGAGFFQVYGYNGSFVELLKFNNTGNITASVGNFVPATAGKGIDFSANANAPGMTSELLNWYEEGVWTGTLTGDVAAPTTPVTVSGRYTRIGRQVTVQISLFNVNTTGASGVMLITGLPFASSAERAYGSCFFIGMGSAVATAHIQSADNRISFLDAVTGAYINISAGAGKYVGASITYTV